MPALLNLSVTMSATTLAALHPGDTATIVSIHAEESLHLRLLALGFRTGRQIELIRKASFSGPLQVRIGTTDVMLRRIEAAKIEILIA
jgi:ferrous iron transport protein A